MHGVVATLREHEHMASGKPIGEFSLKGITGTYSPGPAGSVLDQVNWEGRRRGSEQSSALRLSSAAPKAGLSVGAR